MNRIIHSSAGPRRACQGFSLFEVLITVVVVGIGLLGLAGLQFAGLRASNSANQHTIAAQLAQDVIERIRANRAGAQGGNYNNVTLDSNGNGATATNCSGGCNAGGISLYDGFQWSQLINASGAPILPNASIQVTSTDSANFTVTITWGDTGNYTVTTSI